jgi:hypothetical protein
VDAGVCLWTTDGRRWRDRVDQAIFAFLPSAGRVQF